MMMVVMMVRMIISVSWSVSSQSMKQSRIEEIEIGEKVEHK